MNFTDRVIENLTELDARREQIKRDLRHAPDGTKQPLYKKLVRTTKTILLMSEILEKESVTV